MDWSLLHKRALMTFAVVYIGWMGWSLLDFSTGDRPTLGGNYFSTWDMFPGYETWAHRTFAVGKTADGQAVQLFPGPRERFSTRPGGITRLDFFPSYSFSHATPLFQTAIQRQLELFRRVHPEVAIEQVVVVEQFWPSRSNADRQPDYMPPVDVDARYARPITEWLPVQRGKIMWPES